MTNATKRGRPSSFRPEYIEISRKLCLLGATDKQMADVFGISEKTLNTWKSKYPDFLQSLKEGKEMADSQVVHSLFHRAIGYRHDDVHISNYQGMVTVTPIVKHYPPDAIACIFWLKNRQPKLWRDKHQDDEGNQDIAGALSELARKLPG